MSALKMTVVATMFILGSTNMLFGATVDWTTWTSQPTSASAVGTVTVGSEAVSVNYSGEIAFTLLNGTGFNYFQPVSTFTAAPAVNNPPVSDMIAILGTDTTHTITFGTPVVNPVMDIVSLGQAGIDTQYDFSLSSGQSMSILEQGPSYGFWGCDTCLSLSGTTLTGTEGDGVIQFIGTFTSLTWTGANPENWNGFTFGVPVVDPPNATPEPATWASTLLVALIAAPFALRRLTVRAQ